MRMRLFPRRIVIGTLVASALGSPGALAQSRADRVESKPSSEHAPVDLTWQKTEKHVALLAGDRSIWQLSYRDVPKPYFHPVALADGTRLTELRPPDHAWHYALWFSWTSLNGVSYWEEAPRAQGHTKVVDVSTRTRDSRCARIELTLQYTPQDGAPVLIERRSLRVGAPDKDGGYAIDWISVFTPASEDVELKGGVHGGGYAGLAARMSQDSVDWELVSSEGRRDTPSEQLLARTTHGQRAKWMDFTLVDAKTKRPAGLAILDHPSNLRHPPQWHCVMESKAKFGYFNPAPLFSEPYSLASGKTLALQYRILVHPGRTDSEFLNREWERFASSTKRK